MFGGEKIWQISHEKLLASKTLANSCLFALRPLRAWFLEIVSVQMSLCVCVCLCMCLPPRLLITSGVMWHDMDSIQLVKQVLRLLYGNCSH